MSAGQGVRSFFEAGLRVSSIGAIFGGLGMSLGSWQSWEDIFEKPRPFFLCRTGVCHTQDTRTLTVELTVFG